MGTTRRYLLALAAGMSLWLLHLTQAQGAADDDHLHACVAVLSKGLQTGMTEVDYPVDAREDGRGGTVQVKFSVDHRGALGQHSVVRSSGDAVLDDAALQAARRLFPPATSAPSECRLGYSFTATLSVVFKILPGN